MSKKTIFTVLAVLAAGILPILCSSCQDGETEAQPTTQTVSPVTYFMRLQGGISTFDGQTRAAETWADGDVLTIQFLGSSRVTGTATYNSKQSQWTVTASQTLTTEGEELCEVYFFSNPTRTTQQSVTIGAATISYADTQAAYLIDEETGDIIVKAQLAPVTSRLRLTGTPQQAYGITGLQTYTSYSITDNRFTTSTAKLTGTIGSDGTSAYAYVLFADASKRQLTADARNAAGAPLGKACFTRSFDASVLAPGTSGRLKLPTPEDMGAWQMTNTDNGQEIQAPAASAVTVGKVTYSAAPVEASAVSVGNGTVLEAGFVYAKTSNPTMDSQKLRATATASFSARITGLEPQTTYYVRAYVQNERATVLGPQQVFTTTVKPDGTSFEREGFGDEQGWD